MKIGIIGDIHWSKYSSIIRKRGKKYSVRLENCINSINWAEQITSNKCDRVIYLGDFFDSESLDSEELTALNEIEWNSLVHYFLVGNHEMGLHNLMFSSAHILDNITNKYIIDEYFEEEYDNVCLCYLPYILNNDDRILSKYIKSNANKKIVFSHNDISGIQMGKFISKDGFEINDIEHNCNLFINGHLHNGCKISECIYNIGNLTGQNFSEDASIYTHNIFILDTDTLTIEVLENPYALKFFKLNSLEELLSIGFSLNSVITAKLYEEDFQKAKEYIELNPNILAYKLILIPRTNISNIDNSFESLSVDHLEKFQEFVLNRLGNEDIIKEELGEVLI